MSASTPDFVVIGSGPNGLVAACALARRGFRVTVLESRPDRPGGAVASEEATLPGFRHDVGAAFFSFAKVSPAFREIDVTAHGLVWRQAEIETCHPAPDGSAAWIRRGSDVDPRAFGGARDAAAWAGMSAMYARIEADLLGLLLGPIPTLAPALRLLPLDLFRVARAMASSGRALACRMFESEAARRVLPGLALHVDAGPDDRFGAGIGYMLGLVATTNGYPVPEGGAGALTDALLRSLADGGGELFLGRRVVRIVVRNGRATAVRTADGGEFEARYGVLADTSAPSLYLDLLEPGHVPSFIRRRMRRFSHGWGTFKIDWALSGPVPWSVAEARRSAVVHAGDSLDDLARFTSEVRRGQIPEHPYLVIGQQSLLDPTRAPDGRQTLWAYTRVPPSPDGGWDAHREAFADRIDARIEQLAPGFRRTVLARRAVTPPDLEAMDANLVGGDLGGGSNAWHRQLVFRPVFPYFRYRTPVPGLYLCSSYTHPGAGTHGMCGYNAARLAARV